MSQKARNNRSQTTSQGVTLERIHQDMLQNFERIHNAMDHIVQGNVLIVRNLLQLLEGSKSTQEEIGTEVAQQVLQKCDQNRTILPSKPSSVASSTSCATSNPETALDLSANKKIVTCAECGRAFVFGSISDSITKHAKETTCRPFGCSECRRCFKKVSVDDHWYCFIKSLMYFRHH